MDIEKILWEHADADYAQFQQKICPNTGKIIGVRLPLLRKIAKDMMQEDWKAFLQKNTTCYEETMLQGFVIGNRKEPLEEILEDLRAFIPKIQNWAVCDSVCSSLKMAKKYPEAFWKFLLPYLSSQQEFEVRFGIVMMLAHFVKKEKWHQRVAEQLLSISHEGYYVQMAAAWTWAELIICYPEEMKLYLKQHPLHEAIHKMTIRKLMDSRRISLEMKNMWKHFETEGK